MHSRNHLTRTLLGLLAVAAAVGCVAFVSALGLGHVQTSSRDLVVAAAWGCGLAAAVLSVAALQERTNPDDDPRYFATIVRGLVGEWRR